MVSFSRIAIICSMALAVFCCSTPWLFGQVQTFIIYPGDANNDSLVNVRDLLPIGLAYGREVIPREDQDINWAPKPALGIAGETLPTTAVNIVHANANGDFLIDSTDVDAIALNYDSMVVADPAASWQPFVPITVPYCPTLRMQYEQDTVFVGDMLIATLFLDFNPDITVPQDLGIMGMAISMSYDPANVRDSLIRIIPDTAAGDLMFVTASFREAQFFRGLPRGRIDLGAAGRGGNPIVESRQLAEFRFIVEDIIIRNSTAVPFNLFFEDVLIINNREEVFEFCIEETSAVILSDATPVHAPIELDPPRIFPNPTAGILHIESRAPIQAAGILHASGQGVHQQQWVSEYSKNLDLSFLPAGIYFLQLITDHGIFTEKVILRGN